MDESGNHHSQQTDTRTEYQTLHVLTHEWELNSENAWAPGEEHNTLGPVWEWGSRGGRALQQISTVGDGVMSAANHHGTCIAM